MNRQEYLDLLKQELAFLSAEEQHDCVLEFGSHIDDALERQPELSEAEFVSRLPHPSVLAAKFREEAGLADAGTRSAASGRRTSPTQPPEPDAEPAGQSSGFFRNFSRFFRYASGEKQELSGGFETLKRLEITGASADITIEKADSCVYRIEGFWDEHTIPELFYDTETLQVQLKGDADRMTICVPPSLTKLSVKTASGDIGAEIPSGCSVAITTASGDVSMELQGSMVVVHSASGDVRLKGYAGDVDIRTASGDVQVENLSGRAEISTASGDVTVRYQAINANGSFSSASGDILIRVPEDTNPEITAVSMSGDIALANGVSDGRMVGKKLHRQGGPFRLEINTLSGDIALD